MSNRSSSIRRVKNGYNEGSGGSRGPWRQAQRAPKAEEAPIGGDGIRHPDFEGR